MSRLTLIHNQQQFESAVQDRRGRHVLLNAIFDSGEPEAIRLNLASPNSSYFRRGGESATFSLTGSPFRIISPGLLLSVTELSEWSANFEFVRKAAGDLPLGQIPQNDPKNDVILERLQACLYQLLYTDALLNELRMDTELYRAYLSHPRNLRLMDGEIPSQSGQMLLRNFASAVLTYSQIPQLRDYCIQEDVREGDLGPAGEQFREWFQQNRHIPGTGEAPLEYLAYALRPLRLAGADFRWNQQENDARRLSVDLLCRYQEHPVWVELKMKGDTWTSAALQQNLLYGSMLAGENQARRLRIYFGSELQNETPWVAVLVEDQNDPAFLSDFDQTLKFVKTPAAIELWSQHFHGVILGKIRREASGWIFSDWNVIKSPLSR